MPEESKQVYTVTSPVYHEGTSYPIGESIELTDKVAKSLGHAVTPGGTKPTLPPSSPETSPIDLNTASEEDLMQLPGITKTIVQKLVRARPITSLEEAKTIFGGDEQKWNSISLGVTI